MVIPATVIDVGGLSDPFAVLNGKQGCTTLGYLLGIAVECATARLSTWPGLVSCTDPVSHPVWGAKLGQAHML